jgi:MarR family transcriptional regulator for hemolysin
MWLILLALKCKAGRRRPNWRAWWGSVGPTLTHHLDGPEARGLVTRRRDPDNRRVQLVELTADGDDMFHRLRTAAVQHDRWLHEGFADREIQQLR